MAEGSQHVRQADIAGILAILTQTVNQQTQILEEIRTNQKQLSSLDARMVKLEGLMQGTSSGEPAPAPASSSLVNPAGIAEVVAGLSLTLKLAQSNISNASTAHILGQLQADRLQLPSNYKGKGKEVARDAPLEVTDSVQPQDTLIIGEQTTVSPEAKSYQDQDATAQSTGPPTPLSVPAKPLSVLSTTYSSDEPNVLSVSSQRKRKRRINQPRAVSASTLYGKEREVGGPEPSTSGPAAQKRKAEDAEPHSPSRAPRVRKLRRVEVLIMQNPRILERMRIATPLHEALEERRHASRAASPMDVDPYTEAFSSDLSDLSDLTESDVEEGENDTNGEDIATFVERGSEQEVEGQVLAMSDSSDDCQEDTAQEEQPASRPPRRSMLRPNYNYGDLADLGISMPLDEDSDYVPDKSQGDRAPGPSRRPQTRRADAVSPQPESFVGIPVSQTRPKSKPISTPKHEFTIPAAQSEQIPVSKFDARIVEKSSSKFGASAKVNEGRPPSQGEAPKTTLPKPLTILIKPKKDSKSPPPLRFRSDVKKDKPEIQLVPLAGLRRRLGGYEPFDVKLESQIRDVLVTRKFMSETYGGSPQPLYPSISEAKRAAMGGHQHKFAFPTLKRNPEAPLMPGQPGLLCRALSTVPWGSDEIKLIVGIGEAMWGYMGDYVTAKTDSLTKEEWTSLPEHTKQAWAMDVAIRDKYVPLRSRIYLRVEYGREPTEDEVEDQCPLVKSQRSEPTPEQLQQIVDAYSAGHEQIHIWCFKCVGYDANFQRELVDKFRSFIPKKHRMSVQVPGPVPSSTGKARGRPRKHAVTKDEDTKPSRRSSKEFRETAEAGSSSAQVSAVGPPRQAKKLLQKGKRGSKPGPIPSPPASSQASPPPSATQTQQVENTHGNVLNGLRELWSVGRESVIPDSELAQALFERREGMRVLRDEGKITEADYTKLKVFSAGQGRGWDD